MGANIPTEEKDHLSQASGPTLEKLKKAVEAKRLPKLPRGVSASRMGRLGMNLGTNVLSC